MAKCIRRDGEMGAFTLTERGRCNHCGFDVEEMAEILSDALDALGEFLRNPSDNPLHARETEDGYCLTPWQQAERKARAVFAKARGEGK